MNKKNWAKHNLNGINWSATDHNQAPNQPAYSSSKGKQGKGNPEKDRADRLKMAMLSSNRK